MILSILTKCRKVTIKSIDEVNSIKFICVDKETDAVTNDKNTLSCYFKYIDNEKLVKVIFFRQR
jgi:hypothetical protein